MPKTMRKKNKTISQVNRSIPLNRNACNQIQTNVISQLETIGNSIIDQLKGSEYDHLKQQLLNSVSISTNSSSRQLKDVLTDLHAFDCYNQRQYRTIGIGDEGVNGNLSQTIDNKKNSNVVTRTICTRSSKLNTLNNNQEQLNLLPNRTRKRQLSSNTPTPIDTDNSTDKSDVNIPESIEEDITRDFKKC